MKRKVLITGAVAAAAILAGGWALAQSVGHGPGGFGPPFMQGYGDMGPGMMQHMGRGMGPGMMHGGAGPTQFDPARLDTLKSELGITSAQEPAWTKYAKVVQDTAGTMKQIREQAQKQFATVKTAADELLTTLDDTQKAKAQQTLPGIAFGPGAMHAAGMGGPQHRH